MRYLLIVSAGALALMAATSALIEQERTEEQRSFSHLLLDWTPRVSAAEPPVEGDFAAGAILQNRVRVSGLPPNVNVPELIVVPATEERIPRLFRIDHILYSPSDGRYDYTPLIWDDRDYRVRFLKLEPAKDLKKTGYLYELKAAVAADREAMVCVIPRFSGPQLYWKEELESAGDVSLLQYQTGTNLTVSIPEEIRTLEQATVIVALRYPQGNGTYVRRGEYLPISFAVQTNPIPNSTQEVTFNNLRFPPDARILLEIRLFEGSAAEGVLPYHREIDATGKYLDSEGGT